ncbi:type II toxin-antitoxin system Phd/YefM family antitoxin [Sorangium sp. So ce1182]|uniref:type II toxin-antitoxin system Phd/YefM family antitoxin n=1 Tax=Sorangium sp. So ce1182 TaxID=3133334 RepID=UPI003F5F0211
MAEPAEKLSADDLLPLAKKLPRGEQLRLARTLLELEPETGDDLLARRRAGIGRYAGRGWISEDFDAPLPPEIQKYFEGNDDEDEAL